MNIRNSTYVTQNSLEGFKGAIFQRLSESQFLANERG